MKMTKSIIKKANISYRHLSELIGVSAPTIRRYINKENIRKVNMERIEAAAKVIKDNELVWPNVRYNFNDNSIYKKNKKKQENIDKKFRTNFKKLIKE